MNNSSEIGLKPTNCVENYHELLAGHAHIKYDEPVVPVRSKWSCELFGSDTISVRPLEGGEPNAWWRFWQFVMFGHRWTKDE